MSIWAALSSLRMARGGQSILDLFEEPDRARCFSVRLDDVLFDYSKTSIDTEARDLLIQLARDTGVEARRDAMFAGARINETENRAVLHTALRDPDGPPMMLDGHDIRPGIRDTLDRMAAFADAVRSGRTRGARGSYTDIVNIGIGGSDLGPAMACAALAPYHDGPRTHFVSNADGAQIADTLAGLDPGRTLVILSSKSFTTVETMTNAATVRDWMRRAGIPRPDAQVVAITTQPDRAQAHGLPPERIFTFEDWVGGRYSIWSPIGLTLMLAVGEQAFGAFLDGAREMDDHFRTAPLGDNMPVMLALVGIWHHQICGHATRAVLPYDQRLSRLPAYLQQLEMESNGKAVAMDGSPLPHAAGPIVWGEPGTNGQHAFMQLIHQGKQVVPVEFMVAARGHEPGLDHHHRLLLANCFAQSEALLCGRDYVEAEILMRARGYDGAELIRQARHRVFPGNRPSTTLIYPNLTPRMLGQIIALYEHRVFVEGVVLGINSFDQWGVELGKELATALQPVLDGTETLADFDPSTRQLVRFAQAVWTDGAATPQPPSDVIPPLASNG